MGRESGSGSTCCPVVPLSGCGNNLFDLILGVCVKLLIIEFFH